MKTTTLSAAEKRQLKQAAHHLQPTVMLGQHGLTTAVIHETDTALTAHELIKVKLAEDDREKRQQMTLELCQACHAALIGHIGKIAILYRPKPQKKC